MVSITIDDFFQNRRVKCCCVEWCRIIDDFFQNCHCVLNVMLNDVELT